MQSLQKRLRALAENPPTGWRETGKEIRPNLHGMLRYPAMMVPQMQRDIIDEVLASTGVHSHVLDPFVGSGTTMTEALLKGVSFTGIDINPLAALACEAKLAIDRGAPLEAAFGRVLERFERDDRRTIDVDFKHRDKWFSHSASVVLSRLRRSIAATRDQATRKVLWLVLAETIRLCSNSRTSTYKLHKRRTGDEFPADRIGGLFQSKLIEAAERARDYRRLTAARRKGSSVVRIVCNDVRKVDFRRITAGHLVVVTSPPYGDNESTIPYGQFSYLPLSWISPEDLPFCPQDHLLDNTHAIDSASLGGTQGGADHKVDALRLASPAFDSFALTCGQQGKAAAAKKVAAFAYDFLEAAAAVRCSRAKSAHWVITTGNRTVAGLPVPFDSICSDVVAFLDGKIIGLLRRRLPNKRMPERNSMGAMITAETTAVAEFS